jgi:hypothetical protein
MDLYDTLAIALMNTRSDLKQMDLQEWMLVHHEKLCEVEKKAAYAIFDLCIEAPSRSFESRHFHCFITKSTNEKYLREYYDMMNFGGTAHEESQRATIAQKGK